MDLMFIDFLNSEYHDYLRPGRSEERLLKQEWQDSFMAKWGFQELPLPDEKILAELLQFRTRLRTIVNSLAAKESVEPAQLMQIAQAITRCPYVRRLVSADDSYRLEWIPLQKDWNWVLAEIAGSFLQIYTGAEPDRIKICENQDCLWVFYDESKNRNRRWCHNVCGNLMKVRRFRKKQKASE